jgi:exodeoxyribonuclease VII small subunit
MESNEVLEDMSFEDAMRELEKLVDSLDKGNVSLDEAIAAYDRGSQLKDHCQKKLNEAKMKVETIQASDSLGSTPDKLTAFDQE